MLIDDVKLAVNEVGNAPAEELLNSDFCMIPSRLRLALFLVERLIHYAGPL